MAEKKKGIPLTESNPYLRDESQRRKIFAFLAYESSVFEGARGLKRPPLPDIFFKKAHSARRMTASAKKRARNFAAQEF